MKIARVETWTSHVALTRPYTITGKTTSDVSMIGVKLTSTDGTIGLGSATPEPTVTGETFEDCAAALQPERVEWLEGCEVHELNALCREIEAQMANLPGARAALDIALHDLLARQVGLPLCDLLGRAHRVLPTSITIGIKDTADTLVEADEYLGRGFRVLKIKIGRSLYDEIERLRRLRAHVGAHVVLRVDANQAFDTFQTERFFRLTGPFGIEFVEQPLSADDVESMRALPSSVRARIAADESLLSERDALRLSHPPQACGIFNIKLMKCGGVRPALRIATIAETSGIDLMWGCMDESVIGISAALHAAFASPRTRYLDLDGHLDLARDFALGGFELEGGQMRTLDRPGLGVDLS